MRGLVAIVLLVVLLPPAGAQAVSPPALNVLLEPPDGWLEPDGDAVRLPVAVSVSCEIQRVAPPTSVHLEVVAWPAWATAVLADEAFATSEPELCDDGWLSFATELVVRADRDAPAYRHEAVELRATAQQGARPPAATGAMVPLAASFAGGVDASAPSPLLPLAAGEKGSFLVRFTNHANGPVRVEVDVVPRGHGVSTDPPPPFLLESLQAGGVRLSHALVVPVARTRDAETPPVEVDVRWRAAYALDAALEAQAGVVTLLVAPPVDEEGLGAASWEEPSPEVPARVPLPALGEIALLVAAIALAMRRR